MRSGRCACSTWSLGSGPTPICSASRSWRLSPCARCACTGSSVAWRTNATGGAWARRGASANRIRSLCDAAQARLSAVDVTIRAIGDDEFPAFCRAVETAFGHQATDEEVTDWHSLTEIGRTLAVFDEGRIVGTAAAFSLQLTLPAGDRKST